LSPRYSTRPLRGAASSRQQTDNALTRFFALASAVDFVRQMPSFDELLEDTDDKLFNKINNDVEHLLHSLLPPPAVAPDELRQRVHNRSLPTRTGRLTDSNFINRLLFKDIY